MKRRHSLEVKLVKLKTATREQFKARDVALALQAKIQEKEVEPLKEMIRKMDQNQGQLQGRDLTWGKVLTLAALLVAAGVLISKFIK